MTQSQWTAGLTTIAAEEPNLVIQKNMLSYLTTLLQEVCDFGFKSTMGCHALILSLIEERQVMWDDLPAIQTLREIIPTGLVPLPALQ